MSDYNPSDALPTIQALTSRVHALEAELADWQRHGVKVTEDCETCEGDGQAAIDSWELHPCPDCGGTGKKPRDGVEMWEVTPKAMRVVFPAEWLEAE